MKKYGIGVLVAVCVCILALSGPSRIYYSQIDNSRLEQGEARNGVIDVKGGMAYSYTLFSYDENGKGKDIFFGASKVLREGAFIRLTVQPLRGVTAWEEVGYDELPAAVQEHYAPPQAVPTKKK